MTVDLRPEIWRTIRRVGAQGAVFDVNTIRGCLRGAVRRERIRDYVRALEAGGYLAAVAGDGDAPGWQILRDPGAEAPRLRPDGTPVVMGAGREQCWRTLRILGSCTARELALTASTDRWAVAEGEALDYCMRLSRVGILIRSKGPTGDWVFALPAARYTGPLPPQVRRNKEIYDPNTGRVYAPDGTVLEGRRA